MIREPLRHCKRFRAILLASAWVPAVALAASGQTAPAARGDSAQAQLPAFEVVSIKPNKSGSMGARVMFTSDGISVENVSLHMLVREALGVSNDRILGEPGWMNSDRFDIEAKVAADDVPKLKDVKFTERWAMLLPVFEDRCSLKFHHETKDVTEYVLVIVKRGLKMKPATPGDRSLNGLNGADGKGGAAGFLRVQPGEVVAQAVPISGLVRQLSFQFGATVVDKTGLAGKYDFDLKWAQDEGEEPMPGAPVGDQTGAGNPAPPAMAGPSIFTALQEQLGLKLEAHKEPADVIVIDRIEPPSPN